MSIEKKVKKAESPSVKFAILRKERKTDEWRAPIRHADQKSCLKVTATELKLAE